MATAEQRYEAAIAYVNRAIKIVEVPSLWSPIDWYAGGLKTEPVKNDLKGIEARWLRAASDGERSRVARDAELLADRTQENLPGAPQDRQRTNLTKGEAPTFTPATTYAREVEHQAGEVWGWAKEKANSVTDGISSLGTLALVGGGLFLGIKIIDLFKSNQGTERRAAPTASALNQQLQRLADEHSAGSRNGRPKAEYFVRQIGTSLLFRVTRDNGGRYVLLVPVDRDGNETSDEFSDQLFRYERVRMARGRAS